MPYRVPKTFDSRAEPRAVTGQVCYDDEH